MDKSRSRGGSSRGGGGGASSQSPSLGTKPTDEAKRLRDKQREIRAKNAPPDKNRKLELPRDVNFDWNKHGQDKGILGEEVKQLLGPFKKSDLGRANKSAGMDEYMMEHQGWLGVPLQPGSSRRSRQPTRTSAAPSSTTTSTSSTSRPAPSSAGLEHEALVKLFNSVKHLTNLAMSPLPKKKPKKPSPPPPPVQPKVVQPPVVHPPPTQHHQPPQQPSPNSSSDGWKTRTAPPTALEIQNPDIHSTQNPLMVSTSLSRLHRIAGLNPHFQKRLRRADPYPAKRPPRQSPILADSSTQSPQQKTPPRTNRPSSRQEFRTPTKARNSTALKTVYQESPNKQQPPDSTVHDNYHRHQPSRSPDSSTVNNVLRDYREYWSGGQSLRDRGIEQEEIRSYLSAFVTFTEAIHHFNMAVYLLEQDLVSLRDKNSVIDSRRKASKIIDLIKYVILELCKRIQNSDYATQREKHSGAEQRILERLLMMCYRCEAKLYLSLYRATTFHQDTYKLIQENKELFKRIDEQSTSSGTPEFRENRDIRLSKDEWRQIKHAIDSQNTLQKAHIAWGNAERMCRDPTNHDEFFNSIQVIADVPELKFYESSLKDLANYQRAIVNKLRDEIQSNPSLS